MDITKGSTYCCVKSCKNKQSTFEGSFFRIPNDKERARTWVTACDREDLLERLDTVNLYKSYRVCATHFEAKMFKNDLKNRLQPTAIPTIFAALEGSASVSHDHNYTFPTLVSTNGMVYETSEIGKAGQRIVFVTLHKSFEDIDHKELEVDWKNNEIVKNMNPVKVKSTSQHYCNVQNSITTVDQPALKLSPLHVMIPDELENISSPLRSVTSTQTSLDLSAHSPRKEKLRQKIKHVRNQNSQLKRKVQQLTVKLDSLDHITLEQYKTLTYKFCPSQELADFIIAEITATHKQSKRQKNISMENLMGMS